VSHYYCDKDVNHIKLVKSYLRKHLVFFALFFRSDKKYKKRVYMLLEVLDDQRETVRKIK